jgi:hypothetical protein
MAISDSLLPKNINPLSPNGFTFSIAKLPNVSFFCQRVQVPAISLAPIDQPTPFANVAIPGEIMTFSELNIQFLVDEKMENYKAIYAWMVGLAFPDNYDQYKEYIGTGSDNIYTELSRNYSDANLGILDSSNNPTNQLFFKDIFPVALDPIQMESTAMDVNYVIGSATFKYTYFTF